MQSKILLECIQPNPWQTRQATDPEYIAELAKDIQANGLLQKPAGRLMPGTEQVQLAFGHNRLAAFQLLAEQDPETYGAMPVEVRELTDEQMADMAWSENERRRDHTPIDRARAIQKRMQDFGWSQAQAAEHMGLSRPAVSNILRLLKLPDEIQEKVGQGELSERQATALLSLYELPEEIRNRAENRYYEDTAPARIVQAALEGASSDNIRAKVTSLANSFGQLLEQAPWDLDHVFEGDNLTSPACRDCPSRAKERNLCLDKACYQRKQRLWAADYLAKASEASGILPIDEEISVWQVTNFTFGDQGRTLIASGCPNLRLAYDEGMHSRAPDYTLKNKGFPFAKILCGKRSGHCSCLKGLEKKRSDGGHYWHSDNGKAEVASVEELQALAKEARAERRQAGQIARQLVKDAGAALSNALLEHSPAAWRVLSASVHYSLERETKDLEFYDVVHKIAEHIAETHLPYDPSKPQYVLDQINKLLEEAGCTRLPMPEIAAVLKEKVKNGA